MSFKKRGMIALAFAALLLGTISTGWLIGAVNQWLIPWNSFRVFVPPAYLGGG
jgi:hypothetical protein